MSGNMNPRTVLKYFLAREQAEGRGARVRRSIGTINLRNFTPFLMLDHFHVTPGIGGFPSHPHHGQETITYITHGAMAHEDFTGSAGILYPGDLQFMTAGKGVVHSEIPVKLKDDPTQACIGMQLWVDLPENLKNTPPRYRDLKKKEIPIAKPNDKVEVKVISGSSYGIGSLRDLAYTPVCYYHYTVKPGGEFKQEVPADFNSFIYLMEGGLTINDKEYDQYNAIFFNRDGDYIEGKNPANATKDASFVLIGGEALDQKIVQHGPFVETSVEKMHEVFRNYQHGINGFEKAREWEAKIDIGVEEGDVIGNTATPKKDEL
ncbi:hypothetical protein DASC09_047500 [Saccharomycopsis crataegensis]|uniref:Pirin n=1 Tax=Saccharomycopsis crataegensis TaxID=43959 RepID=A0AAV5QS60_9ASCO|nr:hypothetical protein DASC09_047500 [Saccharomycopsis crataegensis]